MIDQVAKILVDAGATNASAARAAVTLNFGGTTEQARVELVQAVAVEEFDPRWLLAEIERARVRSLTSLRAGERTCPGEAGVLSGTDSPWDTA